MSRRKKGVRGWRKKGAGAGAKRRQRLEEKLNRRIVRKRSTKQKVLFSTFWKICRMQIKIYPQTYIEPKCGEFYSNN